ncbi:MAG: DUF6084 family protein [Rhodanobacteraceae bacterium]
MPELDIEVVNVESAKYAAVPMLHFKLAIRQGRPPVPIQSISLQCQIRIDARKRFYKREEKARLTDLFGEPERWNQTLHNMLWTHASMTVPAFVDGCEVDLPVPCSFDFNVAATKYFHGLEFDAIPLLLLFSGSVFYRDEEGALAMDLISWSKESQYRLPIAVWQDMMDRYYPNQAWLCVNREVFEALYEYKRRHGYTGFDEVLTSLLPEAKRAAS